jgi:hypothetical protein
MYLVFSAFNSKPTSVQATNKAFVLYCVYVYAQQVTVISVHYRLVRPIQIQMLLVFLDLPNGIFQREVEN